MDKIIIKENCPVWQWSFEFKLADFWIGVFWKTSDTVIPQGSPTFALPVCDLLDIWICFIPCCPLHIRRIVKK